MKKEGEKEIRSRGSNLRRGHARLMVTKRKEKTRKCKGMDE